MSADTSTRRVSQIEVIQTGARRRWTAEEKLRIVEESFGGRRMVMPTARRYGLSTGQLYVWRRMAREGKLSGSAEAPGFVPAMIVPDTDLSVPEPDLTPSGAAHRPVSGQMVIALTSGRRIIVDSGVDTAALKRVVAALESR